MNKFLTFIADILLRFYMEIIAGFWAVFIIIPIESALYKFFGGDCNYRITTTYWIFFGFYTTFFIVSGALIPLIKLRRINKTLNILISRKQITFAQKTKILKTLKNISSYKSLLSRDGLLNFVLENLFSLSVMFAWFGIEGMISNIMFGASLIVPFILNALFLALLILQSFLDDYVADRIRTKYKKASFSKLCSASKTLTMQIIADIGGGGNSDKMGQLLLEQVIEEISKIINISNNKINKNDKKLFKKKI